jgi:hypothetical protein
LREGPADMNRRAKGDQRLIRQGFGRVWGEAKERKGTEEEGRDKEKRGIYLAEEDNVGLDPCARHTLAGWFLAERNLGDHHSSL